MVNLTEMSSLTLNRGASGVYTGDQKKERQIFMQDLQSVRICYWYWDSLV